MEIVLPDKPSDEVALFLSRLSYGFSQGERIDNGREQYARLLSILNKQQPSHAVSDGEK